MSAWVTSLRLPRCRIAMLAVVVGVAPAAAKAQQGADEWRWNLTPYLWLPTIDGHVKYDVPPDGGGGPDISVGPTDWLELLNFAALFSGSANKGRLGLFTDFVYLDMGGDNDGRVASVETAIMGPGGRIEIPVSADLNLATEFELDGLQWMLGGGYAFADSEAGRHHVFAGVRFLGIDVTTNWRLTGAVTGPGGETLLDEQGGVSKSVDLWDGIVGLKGHFVLGEGGWSVPYSVDVGTGDSDLVWNASLSLAWRFGWGDLVFGYRHLEYDEGPGGVLQDFILSGPGFGATFHF
jgi:hypothetical protein